MIGHWYSLIPIFALGIDTILGDPRSAWHPVVLIGKVISYWEKQLYRNENKTYLFLAGMVLVILSILTVTLIGWIALRVFSVMSEWGYLVGTTLILYITITPKALARDAKEIAFLLKTNDVHLARKRLSWIVGRDTMNLDEDEITRATIETVAENITDGIVSPLFYFFLFGPIGALVYRVSNTLDSMVGYKNERYLFFGKAAARWDDFLNYIPARLTAGLLLLSSFVLGWNTYGGWVAMRRDAHHHPSPNGGYAEATVAGILGIRLGGYNYYQGKREFRAYMGSSEQVANYNHIYRIISLMYSSTLIAVGIISFFLF